MVPFILLVLIIGSVLFHLYTPWYSTPIASNWSSIDSTIELTFAMTGAVYILVLGFMTYCVIKFRSNKSRKADYEPESKKAEVVLTVLTTIGVAGSDRERRQVLTHRATHPAGVARHWRCWSHCGD